jgi:GNAT superfamily N-acetyltransferase
MADARSSGSARRFVWRYNSRVRSPWSLSRASPGDYAAFARLFPELAVPEATPSATYFAQTIVPDAIVLRHGDVVVGYACARPHGDRLHIVHVIADPEYRRRGVGRALIAAVAERARAAGFQRWRLNVKPENVAARALYERWGMNVVLASVSMRVGWSYLERIPSTPGAFARTLAPADDERFEDAFALSRGEVSSFRATAGRILIGAEDARGPAGVAAFDPNLAGASLFQVRSPEHARGLLEEMRSHAEPGHDHVRVFVEGDPALEAALAGAGAEAVMRALRMEGQVPDGASGL